MIKVSCTIMIPKINFNHYEQNIEQFGVNIDHMYYVIDILLDTIEIISKQNKNNNLVNNGNKNDN